MDIWQNYWDTGTPTSMATGFKDGYNGQILAFWRSQLRDKTGHVVDLACGNGALSWLVDSIVNGHGPRTRVTGVDFAGIDPFAVLKKKPAEHPMMSFLGETPLESLPFQNASIDVAVSQWGLEYSDITRSVAEIGRVLKPRSRICLICHAQYSDILKRTRSLAAKYPIILRRPQLFDLLFGLDDLYNSKTNIKQVRADPLYSELSASIREITSYYEQELQQFNDPTVVDIQAYLKSLFDLFSNMAFVRMPGRRAAIAGKKLMLEMSEQRFQDLFSAALSDDAFSHLLALIEHEGFEIELTEDILQTGIGNIGRAIVAAR